MQSADVRGGNDCHQFFAAFDQIKTDDTATRNTGLTVFQVEELLGPPNTVSSGVGHNVYMYSVGRCSADIEFLNGRTVRKTFSIGASPVPSQAQAPPPAKPQQAGLVWALAIITAISLIALLWNIFKHRRSPYEDERYEADSQWPADEARHESRPVEPQPVSHTAGLDREPHNRTPEQHPRKRKEDPRSWYEAS